MKKNLNYNYFAMKIVGKTQNSLHSFIFYLFN